MRARHFGALAMLLASIGFAYRVDAQLRSPVSTGRDVRVLEECKAHWDSVTAVVSDTVLAVPFSGGFGRYTLSGVKTDVPEYHDCQRLIVNGKYGPVVALFAAYDLESLDSKLTIGERISVGSQGPTVNDSTRGLVSTPVVDSSRAVGTAAILVLNMGATYAPLGLRTGFSCLYVWRVPVQGVTQWRAKVRYVGVDENRCTKQVVDPESFPGTLLRVKPMMAPGFTQESHYPAVARWDRDTITGLQYIGVKCGPAWCEIGKGNFKPSSVFLAGANPVTAINQVQAIKGWYDEQLLAYVDESGEDPVLRPSKVKATVIPDASLGSRLEAAYQDTFVLVAYIKMSHNQAQYRRKLNLYKAAVTNPTLDDLNRLYYCKGTRDGCKVPPDDGNGLAPITCDLMTSTPVKWWVKIVPATGSPTSKRRPVYRCVTEMKHPQLTTVTPSTSRWRWLEQDETVWRECLNGCCKVEQLQ